MRYKSMGISRIFMSNTIVVAIIPASPPLSSLLGFLKMANIRWLTILSNDRSMLDAPFRAFVTVANVEHVLLGVHKYVSGFSGISGAGEMYINTSSAPEKCI